MDVALYLLESGANYEISLFDRSKFTENGSKVYISVFLREHMYDLDSYEYSLKMKIGNFLKQKGVDYRKTPIPESIEKKPKELYPKSYQDYLAKY